MVVYVCIDLFWILFTDRTIWTFLNVCTDRRGNFGAAFCLSRGLLVPKATSRLLSLRCNLHKFPLQGIPAGCQTTRLSSTSIGGSRLLLALFLTILVGLHSNANYNEIPINEIKERGGPERSSYTNQGHLKTLSRLWIHREQDYAFHQCERRILDL